MAALTPEDVANMALAILDEAEISSMEDDNMAARLLNRHFDITVEAELSKHAWVFAIFSEEVAGTDIGTGSGTLNYAYEIPADALRVLPLTYDGEPAGIPIAWRQEAGLIYTDQSSPRIIRYIANLTDPNDWDALFTEVVVAALARKVALAITHKQSMADRAQQAYEAALSEAMRVNAVQVAGALYQASWASQRGDNRYWRA